MKAPDKLYIPQHNIEAGTIQELCELIVEGSVEYICKDLLLEWAKELTSEPYDRTTESALKHQIAHYLLDKLNSL